MLILTIRLFAVRRRLLGSVSVAALAVALWAQFATARGRSPADHRRVDVFAVAYLWFWVRSATLAYSGLFVKPAQ